MLEVRILPGEPNLFDLKQLQRSGRAFGFRPNAWDVKGKSAVRKLLKGSFFWGTCPESNKRCHKNVVPRLDFRAAGSLLVAAARAFWLRGLIDHSVRNQMLGYFFNRLMHRNLDCFRMPRPQSRIGPVNTSRPRVTNPANFLEPPFEPSRPAADATREARRTVVA